MLFHTFEQFLPYNFNFSPIWWPSSSLTSSKITIQTFQELVVFPTALIAANTLWEPCHHFMWLHSILYCSSIASQSETPIASKKLFELGLLEKMANYKSGQEISRWSWDILVWSQARSLWKMNRVMAKAHQRQLKGILKNRVEHKITFIQTTNGLKNIKYKNSWIWVHLGGSVSQLSI